MAFDYTYQPNTKVPNLLKSLTPTVKIADIYNAMSPASIPVSGTQNQTMIPVTRDLPNGGGTYNSQIVAPPTKPPVVTKPIFQPTPPAPSQQTGPVVPPQYIDPKTGQMYTPEAYSAMISQKAGGGSVPNYAGNSLTQGPQSTAQLTSTATDLNNQRNDIASGTTDPYKAASQSGIAYSPQELNAIEKAYAGVYDPALKDVFTKLDAKQKQDAADLDLKNQITLKQTASYSDLHPSAGGSNGLTANQLQNSLDKVNDDFRMDPATQQYTQAASGWDALSKINPDKATSADDIATIYAFAKIMDPGSVVREGEYNTVQKYAQSWAQSFGFNAARIFSNTKFLSPDAVRNMQNAAKSKAASLESAYTNAKKTYEGRQQALLSGNIASGLPDYGYQTASDNITPSKYDNLMPQITIEGTTAYLPRAAWTPLSQEDKDGLLAEAKIDGYNLLIK